MGWSPNYGFSRGHAPASVHFSELNYLIDGPWSASLNRFPSNTQAASNNNNLQQQQQQQ